MPSASQPRTPRSPGRTEEPAELPDATAPPAELAADSPARPAAPPGFRALLIANLKVVALGLCGALLAFGAYRAYDALF